MDYPHLDPEALLRSAYGVATATEAQHRAACPACASAVAALEGQRRSAASRNALEELPETFWGRQQQEILARMEQRPAAPGYRRFAAAVSLVILLGVIVLSGGDADREPLHTVQDEQLLRDINLIVNRIEPRALTPATLFLPDEMKEVRQP